MKFSVFTVMVPDMTVGEVILLLKENGYDGVEWRFKSIDPLSKKEEPSFWGNNLCTVDSRSSKETLQRLKEKTDKAGLAVPNLACYLTCGDVENTERAMMAAKWLGAPSIRVGVPAYNRQKNYWELFDEARSYLQKVEQLSEKYSVKGIIEIHMNTIASSASMAYRLVDGFNPEHIGVIYDPGNMVFEGYEQYRMGLELLGSYLAHVHVKNAHWIRNEKDGLPVWRAENYALADGFADWRQVIEDLKAVGYDGWLSFEDFSQSDTSRALLAKDLAYIQSFVKNL